MPELASRPNSSVMAVQLLSAGFQRYAPPTSVRAYTRSFSTGLKMTPLTNPPPRMTTFFQLYATLFPSCAGPAAAVAAPGTCAPGPWAQEHILQPGCAKADKITANDVAHEVCLVILLAPYRWSP